MLKPFPYLRNLKMRWLAVITVAAMLQPPFLAIAQQLDKLTVAQAESTGVAIRVKYPPDVTYKTNVGNELDISVKSKNGANLSCLQGYLDFRYRLEDAAGTIVPFDHSVLLKPPMDHTIFDPREGTPRWCEVVRTENRFLVKLSALYPQLKAGDYTLDITFAPRNRSLSGVALGLPALKLTYVP